MLWQQPMRKIYTTLLVSAMFFSFHSASAQSEYIAEVEETVAIYPNPVKSFATISWSSTGSLLPGGLLPGKYPYYQEIFEGGLISSKTLYKAALSAFFYAIQCHPWNVP